MTIRRSKIDDLTRPDHAYLRPEDTCSYLGEYTARRGFSYSEMNKLIINLKKPMDRRGKLEWRYKEEAIATAARAFRSVISLESLRQMTLVPIPPSKRKDHGDYDDRMLRILQHMNPGEPALDIRELLAVEINLEPAHLRQDRPTIAEIRDSCRLDEGVANPVPKLIALFDDVLTTGTHFRAAKETLEARFPNVPIGGFFLARRVPEAY